MPRRRRAAPGESTLAVDEKGPVEPARYREFMSHFPTGLAIVTAVGLDGRPLGATCSSLSSVSAFPPTLLVCLDERSSTLRAIADTGWFGINLLGAGSRSTSELFASGRPDRFESVAWRPFGHRGVPEITGDPIAVAECRVEVLQPVADHVVVVGQVSEARIPGGMPLLYAFRGYSCWQADGTDR